MAYQSEAALEQQFIEQLTKQEYTTVAIPDYDALVENFKVQFEAFNAPKLDAVGRVMGLNQCFLITLGRNVEIPISQSFRPLCGLTFTWDGAFERNSRIGCFQPQHDLGGIHIYTDCHSGYKVRDAFIFDEIDDLLPESFFEVYAAFVFLIETKREVLRTMPGKSTGLHFLFHLLTMY